MKQLCTAAFLLAIASALWSSGVIPAIIPAAVPAANKQGNGSLFQLSTGSTTTNDCGKFDANGNNVDAGAACGVGTVNSGAQYALGYYATASTTLSGITNVLNSAGAPYLPNASIVSAIQQHAASGDVDLYTVPAGSKVICPAMLVYNDSGSGVNIYTEAKISGTYYRMIATVSPGANAAAIPNVYFVFSAGQTVSINIGTASVLNVFPVLIQFDVSASLSSAFLTTFSAGNNTLFTASGNGALILSAANGTANFLFFGETRTGNVNYLNNSGTSRTVSMNCVPSGGSVGTNNRIENALTITTGTTNSVASCATLASGDFVNINTDANTAGQFAWVNYVQF